jgi:branched-subunit amino acid aminotransferase/4-amino-4-deoxychorismate lyase
VCLDGAIVPEADAKVAANDRGLLQGRGLFETFRVRRGRPVYRLADHLARLEAGAEVLGMTVRLALADVEQSVRLLAERCGLDDARVRLTLTAGTSDTGGSVLIQARAATDYPERLYEVGASAIVAHVRRNETSPLSRVKSLNCLDNMLAREAARQAGADEALLLNSRGVLAEGSVTNVFVVRGGELLTPPLEDGALPGVTRAAVLELARGAGVAAGEAPIALDELTGAGEAFLTNAIAGVLPLVAVDGVRIGDGGPGVVTGRLRALYEAASR